MVSDTTVVQVVRLADGSVLYGRVEDLGPPVRVRLRSGQELQLDPATIREVTILEGRVVDGEVWEADSNPTRLFFAPTARTTPAGTVADEPAVVGGFETRVSRRVKLISENWYIPGGVGLVSLGPRFMGSRLSADVGVGYAFADGDGVVVPLVNFVVTW